MKSTPILFVLGALACAPAEQAPLEEPQNAALDTLRAAELAYDASAFDSISWETAEAASERGSVVFRFSCEKCHGTEGRGDGGFVTQGDTVRPPSFREPDWRFADDHDGLRRQIFVGTAAGMPHWGLEGLKPRDIDAVASYLRQGLRGGS